MRYEGWNANVAPKERNMKRILRSCILQFVVRNLLGGDAQGVYDPYRTSTSVIECVIDPYLDSKG